MGCALSKPEPPKARLLHDLSKPYKYPSTQHPPGRHQPMQYAAQAQAPHHRQTPPRLPVNARVRDDRRQQDEPLPRGHRANPKPSHEPQSQAPSNHKANRKHQINPPPKRAPSSPPTTHQPSPSPWPLQNPIPNRFESPFPHPPPPTHQTHPPITWLAKTPLIIHPPFTHHSHHATIATPLSPSIETKPRLSRYWDTDPITGYGPPSPTESEERYRKMQRLSRPLGAYGLDMPEVVPASPVERKGRGEKKRAMKGKGKGRGLRVDIGTGKGRGEVRRHEDWVGGGEARRMSLEFKRIEAIEMGLVDREGERRREEEWNRGMRI
ncbi:hypothetical protein N7G274_001588 [Stereocaulon virgatum]|uniref:Uncharacterized protein n=1 Tax=Stereocaulon virgatum TaxID=373712 RepID=A0ABR4AMW3_9LECA